MLSIRHSSEAAEPRTVPSSKVPRRYHAPSQPVASIACRRLFGVGAPPGRAGGIARLGQRSHPVERRDQEPSQPDAGAASTFAHPVHPVVPVAGADQRHSIRAGQRDGLIEPPGAMVEEARRRHRHLRLEEGIVRAGIDLRPFEERHLLVQHGLVAADGDIVRHAITQPHAVVGNARPHPLARVRQPPVLHVALGKLAGGRAQEVRACHVRPREGQRHAILQLVAEAIGPAGLIESRPRPNAAG